MPPRNRTRKTTSPKAKGTKAGATAATPAVAFTRTGPLISMDGKDIIITNPSSFPATPIWDELYASLGDPHSPLTEIDSLRAAKAITDPADPVWEEVYALFGNSHEGLPAAGLSPEPEPTTWADATHEERYPEDDAPADPVQEPEETTDGEVGVAQAGDVAVDGTGVGAVPEAGAADPELAGAAGHGVQGGGHHVPLTSRPGTTDATTTALSAPSPADAATVATPRVDDPERAGDDDSGNPGR